MDLADVHELRGLKPVKFRTQVYWHLQSRDCVSSSHALVFMCGLIIPFVDLYRVTGTAVSTSMLHIGSSSLVIALHSSFVEIRKPPTMGEVNTSARKHIV